MQEGSSTDHSPRSGEEVSDRVLLEAARRGDERAFSDLWSRHVLVARYVASSMTQAFDADDVVSEAYLRVWAAMRAGKGPVESFRPYLFVTVRNVIASWVRRSREFTQDALVDVADPRSADVTSVAASDASLVLKAFRSLPSRWQEVLWYTEVEGEGSTEVGRRLGLTANSAAALAYRAREALRQAWVQEHVATAGFTGIHLWVRERVGRYAQGALSSRQRERFAEHVTQCDDCGRAVRDAAELSGSFTSFHLSLAVGIVAAVGVVAVAPGSAPSAYALGTIRRGFTKIVRSPRKWRAAAAVSAGLLVLGGGAVALAVATGRAETEITEPAPVPAPVPAPATGTPQPSVSPPAGGPTAPQSDVAPRPAPTSVREPPPIVSDGELEPSASDPPSPAPSASPQSLAFEISRVDTGDGALFPVVSGTGRPGASVVVSVGSSSTTTTINRDGHWETSPVVVRPGVVDVVAASDGSEGEVRGVNVGAPVLSVSRRGDSVTVSVRGAPTTSYDLTVAGVSLQIATDAQGGAVAVVTVHDDVANRTVKASAASVTRPGPVAIISLP